MRSAHRLALTLLLTTPPAAAWLAGCVGDEPTASAGDASTGDVTSDGDLAADGSGGGDSGNGAADASSLDASGDAGLTCSASELLCDGGCVQNTASNCGGCGVTCAPDGGTPYCSPTNDAGTSYACASGCSGSLVLCGSSCINEQTNKDNCGGCGAAYACSAGQECVGGHCVCDGTSCPNGCCTASGACVTAPACGTAGATCSTGCPLTLPEANTLALWFVADDYVPPNPGQNGSWLDRSGNGANATCTSGNCPATGTVNSHKTAYFGGVHFLSISDPSADLQSNQWTFLLVVKPNPLAAKYTPIFALAIGPSQYISFSRPLTDDGGLSQDIQFSIYPGSLIQGYFASLPTGKAWAGNWERVSTTVDTTGNAVMDVFNTSLGVSGHQYGTIGPSTMNNFDYNHSAIGANTDSFGQPFFQGEIAEILVFRQAIAPASLNSVNGYLTSRYNF